ncbi:hypothetical protein GE09DRAFT_1230155 [Coniochaeta sp. 2T2.1]|nr:hypothetical protein GE09DRAFT_1230155 [Coniochaeta sp. 2T2.1]
MPTTSAESGNVEATQAEEVKTRMVQRLNKNLPKAGFDYGNAAPPFTGTSTTGYVIVAMKEFYKITSHHIYPSFVDKLIGATFKEMSKRVHAINSLGQEAFWKQVCRHTRWSGDCPRLITGKIGEELAIYMMEGRLRFKQSGFEADPKRLGDAAKSIDNYFDKLAVFNLHAHIPVVDPDNDDLDEYDEAYDYDEDEVDDDDVLRMQKETECDLAVLYEHTGVYDHMIGDGQYEPSWDENCDLVQLPADYPDEQGTLGQESTYAPMDLDHVDDEFMNATKKQRISEDQDSVPTSTSAQASSGEHKSEELMNQDTAKLVTMMRSTNFTLGRKRSRSKASVTLLRPMIMNSANRC